MAARCRLTQIGPAHPEPLALVHEGLWYGCFASAGCELMRPIGSQDEIGARGLDLGNGSEDQSGCARITMPDARLPPACSVPSSDSSQISLNGDKRDKPFDQPCARRPMKKQVRTKS
jgi:hypothetical protein